MAEDDGQRQGLDVVAGQGRAQPAPAGSRCRQGGRPLRPTRPSCYGGMPRYPDDGRAPAAGSRHPAHSARWSRTSRPGCPGSPRRRSSPSGSSGAAVLFVLHPAPPALLLDEHHPRRRRHGRPRVGPRLPARPPAAPLPHHRLGPRLVRRLPRLPVLLPAARPADRRPRRVLPYGIAFKLVTVLGPGHPAVAAWAFGRLSGMRFPGPACSPSPPCRSSSTGASRSTAATSRRPWRASSPSRSACRSPCCSSASWPAASTPAAPGPGGRPAGPHRPVPPAPRRLRRRRRGLLLLLRPGQARLKLLGRHPACVGALLAAFWSLPFLLRLPTPTTWAGRSSPSTARTCSPTSKTWLVAARPGGRPVRSARSPCRRRVGLFLVGMAAIAGAAFVVAPAAGCGTPGCCRSGTSASTCWPAWP